MSAMMDAFLFNQVSGASFVFLKIFQRLNGRRDIVWSLTAGAKAPGGTNYRRVPME